MSIDKLISAVQDKYGQESIGYAKDMKRYDPISSGSLTLDFAIGIGGLPSDRVIEVAGDEGSGKTTLGLLSMATFLRAQPKRYAVILDLEHKITEEWAVKLVGKELWERVLYAQPDHMEMATNMYVDVVSSGEICFVLLDSIGGAATKAATEKDAEKAQVGGNAPAVTKFARLASTMSAKYRCLTFCVNQVRDDMDGFRRHMTPGGRGFKHACILRIKLRRGTKPDEKIEETINGEKMLIGGKIHAQCVKNQLAAPYRTASWWMYHVETDKYGFGIDTLDEVIRLAIATGVINQRVSQYDHQALPGGTVKSKEGLAKAIAADDSLKATIVSETMAVLTEDKSLLAEVAPIGEEVVVGDE